MSIDTTRLNIGTSFAAGAENGVDLLPRDELERRAIFQLVGQQSLWGLQESQQSFADLFFELKESVRSEAGEVMASRIVASQLVEKVLWSCHGNVGCICNHTTGTGATNQGGHMIIESIRLKNIKSYGEGLDGAGITIPFQNGVNRVAGRNGHGKTTLIESPATLVFTEPQFEETSHIETYFLAMGPRRVKSM